MDVASWRSSVVPKASPVSWPSGVPSISFCTLSPGKVFFAVSDQRSPERARSFGSETGCAVNTTESVSPSSGVTNSPLDTTWNTDAASGLPSSSSSTAQSLFTGTSAMVWVSPARSWNSSP